MQMTLTAIGTVRTTARELPRHCRISGVPGVLEIDAPYVDGLADIQAGERLVVLFGFHESPAFTPDLLKQTPPHQKRPFGVFSTCSPRRPNSIGMSVVTVQNIQSNRIHVKGLDMRDGTPIFDLKPYMDLSPSDDSPDVPDRRA